MEISTEKAPLEKGPLLMRQWQARCLPTEQHPQFWDAVYWWANIDYYDPDNEPEQALRYATRETDRIIFAYAAVLRSRPPHGLQTPIDALKHSEKMVSEKKHHIEALAWREALKSESPYVWQRLLYKKKQWNDASQKWDNKETDPSFDEAIEYLVEQLTPENNHLLHLWHLSGGRLRDALKTVSYTACQSPNTSESGISLEMLE